MGNKKLDQLLKELVPEKGAALLNTIQTLESLLKRARRITYEKLQDLKEDPSRQNTEDWWNCLRAMLLIYLTLSEVILETCDYLIPIAEDALDIPDDKKFKQLPRYFEGETDTAAILEEVVKKIKEESKSDLNVLILPGDDTVH